MPVLRPFEVRVTRYETPLSAMKEPLTKFARLSLRGPQDLVDKLWFDLRRLNEAQKIGRKEAIYASFDCAVTSWSILDWTFHNLNPEQLNRLTNETGTRDGLRKTLNRRIPHLNFCYQLATGAKHYFVGHKPAPDLDSGVSELRRRQRNPATGETQNTEIFYWPYVMDNGAFIYLDELFSEMAVHWQIFLREEGLDQLVGPSSAFDNND